MSDIAKWGILVALIVTIIVIVLTLPFAQYLDLKDVLKSLHVILEYGGEALYTARTFINLFLFDFARNVLSGILFYLFGKWFLTITFKIATWVGHYIFK